MRDLGGNERPPERRRPPRVCDHRRMRWCCRVNCGHLRCPGCGLTWDVGAER